MSATIATWNINSVRIRMDLVSRFVAEHRPDILCLQEIKCIDEQFPRAAFHALGYPYIALSGQKGYHGVATLSRHPFAYASRHDFCLRGDARHVAMTMADDAPPALRGLSIHNFYVPAGGDEPDRERNPKFAHKLDFLAEMRDWCGALAGREAARTVLVGDLNVAPLETDVWSHKQLLKVVSHTPVEVDHLNAVQAAGGWVDAVRKHIPPSEKLFTWWSYRAADWRASNRGRRLDHIWVSPDMAGRARAAHVMADARGWQKASDHVPVIAALSDAGATDAWASGE